MKKMREYLLTVAQLLCSELGGSPDKAASGGMAEALFGSHDADDAGDSAKTAKEMSFPDSWMEQPGDAPFMFSFEADDLTGNKASFCIQGPGAEWATPFSLESMGTTGVLAVSGCPSELPALKGTKPLYEFGLAFELGSGNYSRSKVWYAIVPARLLTCCSVLRGVQLCGGRRPCSGRGPRAGGKVCAAPGFDGKGARERVWLVEWGG